MVLYRFVIIYSARSIKATFNMLRSFLLSRPTNAHTRNTHPHINKQHTYTHTTHTHTHHTHTPHTHTHTHTHIHIYADGKGTVGFVHFLVLLNFFPHYINTADGCLPSYRILTSLVCSRRQSLKHTAASDVLTSRLVTDSVKSSRADYRVRGL
jgi:hypothetical protein